MPSKNIVKEYVAEQYYHIYSRGVAKQIIFLDDQDYRVYLNLFSRYLSLRPTSSPRHGLYPFYGNRAELLAYCLMPNHIHMLVYQKDATAIIDIMRSIMTSYSMYFNKKYKRVGPVFQSRYKASRITRDDYLEHISRYIHLNPKQWQSYPYSSLKYYIGYANAEWVRPEKITSIFVSNDKYLEFVKDYEGHKEMLDEIKWDLADLHEDGPSAE